MRVVYDAAHDVERATHPAGQRAHRAIALIVQTKQFEELAAALLDRGGCQVV